MHFAINLQMIWPIMYMKYKFISPRKVLLVLMITKKLEFLGAKDSQCDFTGRKEEKEKTTQVSYCCCCLVWKLFQSFLSPMTSNFPLSYAPFMKQRVGSTILDLVYFCSPFWNYSNFSSFYGGKLEVL